MVMLSLGGAGGLIIEGGGEVSERASERGGAAPKRAAAAAAAVLRESLPARPQRKAATTDLPLEVSVAPRDAQGAHDRVEASRASLHDRGR
jgi:hypothetical protein